MTSRRTFIKVAGGAAATPAIISLGAVPSFASGSTAAPIVLDDFSVSQAAVSPSATNVTGSMIFGERRVDASNNPGREYTIGGGTADFTVPSFPAGITMSYPAAVLGGPTTIDLSACTTIRVGASPGLTVTAAIQDTVGGDVSIQTEFGGFITVPLAAFGAVDLTQVDSLLFIIRNSGTMTGPLVAF